MKRGITKDFIWSVWKFEVEKVGLNYFDVFNMVLCEVFTKFCGGFVVFFDGDDVGDTVRECASNYAGAGTDFDNGVTFFEVRMTDQNKRKPRAS